MLKRVQPKHLRKALFHGALARAVRRAVVAAAFRFAGTAAHRAHVLGFHHDLYRLQTLGKIAAHRRHDDHEHRRMHAVQTQLRIRAEQERANVQRSARLGRHPVLIQLHQFAHRLQSVVRIQLRKSQSIAGSIQARDVVPRAEQLHAAVRTAIRLHALEYLRAVMENGGGGRKRQRAVGNDARSVPAVLFIVIHDEHMIGEIIAEAQLFNRRHNAAFFTFRYRDFHGFASFRFPSDVPCCGGCPRSIRGILRAPHRSAAVLPPVLRRLRPARRARPRTGRPRRIRRRAARWRA